MPTESSDAAFLDLMEAKVRAFIPPEPDERKRLFELSDTNLLQNIGTQRRVNLARQRVIDRVTKTLVD